MNIVFSLRYDGRVYPAPWDLPENQAGLGQLILGPQGLVALLETQLGLPRASSSPAWRTEQFRRRMARCDRASQFYSASFRIDPLGCARRLLALRDELKMAGWTGREAWAGRLAEVAELEQHALPLDLGPADRISRILDELPEPALASLRIACADSPAALPGLWRQVLQRLAESGVAVAWNSDAPERGQQTKSDLDLLRRYLQDRTMPAFQGDGSVVVVRTPSDGAAADALGASGMAATGSVLITAPAESLLDDALAGQGVPRSGLAVDPGADPVLQLLPLVLSLLWEPRHPEAILTLLTLPVSPIRRDLAGPLARAFMECPGTGPHWDRVLRECHERIREQDRPPIAELRAPLDALVLGPTYSPAVGVPVSDLEERLQFLIRWARRRAAKREEEAARLGVLALSAENLGAMFHGRTQPIPWPELNRALRMCLTSSPASPTITELGSMPAVADPGALTGQVGEAFWWNCTDPGRHFDPPFWSAPERRALEAAGVRLELPEARLEAAWRAWERPVQLTQKRLVLFVPATVDGAEVAHHPLVDRILAIPGADVLFVAYEAWLRGRSPLPAPQQSIVTHRALPSPTDSFLLTTTIGSRATESYSSLELLFFLPHYYVLSYACSLHDRQPALKPFALLRGSIAHAVLEAMVQAHPTFAWSPEVKLDVLARLAQQLQDAGLPFLQPKLDPARRQMEETLTRACCDLFALLRANEFRLEHIEQTIRGSLDTQPLSSTPDIVLAGNSLRAILDFKYSGAKYKREEIEANRSMQLAIYRELLAGDPVAAYFIVTSGQTLEAAPARLSGSLAVETVGTHANLMEQIRASFRHRRSQLERGLVEIPFDEKDDNDQRLPAGCLAYPEHWYGRPEYDVILGRFAE